MEAQAVIQGLYLVNHRRFFPFTIETDSQQVCQKICSPQADKSLVGDFIQAIRDSLWTFHLHPTSVQCIRRNANVIADSLTTIGSHLLARKFEFKL